jgi:predicted  nucleic acid-binding Zn-ribbon protein
MVKKLSARKSDKTIDDLFLLVQNLEKRLISIENKLTRTNHPDSSIPDQIELIRSQIMDQLKLYAKIQKNIR